MATFLVFGITGDLARNKIVPALFNLYVRREVNQNHFLCIGVGRKKFSKEEFQSLVSEYITSVSKKNFSDRLDIKEADLEIFKHNFILSCIYIYGEFGELSLYNRIRRDLEVGLITKAAVEILCQLAVPPNLHDIIIDKLIESKIIALKPLRLMLEKPFGHDHASAKKLYTKISAKLNSNRLLLIDHYLGKDAIIELENTRMAGYLEPLLKSKYIKSIEVILLENKTVAGRGLFYDTVGALKDVGQNHLLQVLALAASEYKDSRNLDRAKAKFLSSLRVDSKKNQIFAQYSGYLKEENVKNDSTTETFFSVGLKSTIKAWQGTEFRITSGKAFKSNKSEIIYTYADGQESRLSIAENSRAAYEYILLGALHENTLIRADISQVLASWKIIGEIDTYRNQKKLNLSIYEKGTEAILKKTKV